MTRLAMTAVVAALVTSAACSSAHRDLRAIALPNLGRLDPPVQAQLRSRYDEVNRAVKEKSPDDALANAYGQYGMVLQAAEYYDAAEPCYLNAQTLAPEDVRWPYYLAGVYKSRGETQKAETAYARALQLQSNDLATLIWLGRLDLDQGKTDAAATLFQKAYTLAPNDVSVLAGLGRVAVDKHDYASAVKYLEQALQIDPEADSLHAPLATAYRGLGDLDRARPHIGQWRNRDLPVPDPRQQDLDLVLESGLSYELRGIREFEVRDWKAAAEYFRKGLSLTHDNSPLRRSLQHKLGTALYLTGDVAGAEQAFQAVVDAGPKEGIDESTAKANYSLAVLMASGGRPAQALQHFDAAIKSQPNYVEAHLAMADVLRRTKQADAALVHYREALAINPRQPIARLGYAMALVDAKRYRDARDWLDAAAKQFPDRAEFKLALARVLAASPDDRVRDGARALAIAQDLFKGQKTTPLGETIAMALAESGDFAQAVAVQTDVLAAAKQAGLTAQVARMTENLARYERHQPCRTPWAPDELELLPTAQLGQ